MTESKKLATSYLKKALGDHNANFRSGQWKTIERLLRNKRVLSVQRTGWGKSMVYFLTTKLLRKKGFGPTLLISPLLSLMRNQVSAAERLNLNARTINSNNCDTWRQTTEELAEDKIDILLISPERLSNTTFREEILPNFSDKVGLFVIDEAHCISDWGHDFRPDYRRIVRILEALPSNIPVLATTATANKRVVKDVIHQLGHQIELIRGSLVRKSLRLQNIVLENPLDRLSWLASQIPNLPGSGIVYTLTKRDAERVAGWLKHNNIKADVYHSDAENRQEIEERLLNNDVKVVVATVALGMGFDKPDLGFVIHYQRPASVVHYYQQVGRAGRAVDEAYGILLHGREDDDIANYFIRTAFPPQSHIEDVIGALRRASNGLTIIEMQKYLNLSMSKLKKAIKYMTLEYPSPITNISYKWFLTPAAKDYKIDLEHVERITSLRKSEQFQMQKYMTHSGCLMAFLQEALDDADVKKCGTCMNCHPGFRISRDFDKKKSRDAALYLRRCYLPIEPRKRWPRDAFPAYNFKGKISDSLQFSEGRALSLWRDAGWGEKVYEGKYVDSHFSDELVKACAHLIKSWSPEPVPVWITCIPSFRHPELVPDFAKRLAKLLKISFCDCIVKVNDNQYQKNMENSFQQARNLDGVFEVILKPRVYPPCILVDDMVDSRWTFTVASALLRKVGCEAVYPLALALNSPRM